MRKKIIHKVIILAFIMFFNLIISNKVFASEASLSVSPSEVSVGESFSVTVNMPQDAVGYSFNNLIVTYSDGSTDRTGRKGYTDVNNLGNWVGNFSASFTAKVSGNVQIVVEDLTLSDKNYNKLNSNNTLRYDSFSVRGNAVENPVDNSNNDSNESSNDNESNNSSSNNKPETPSAPVTLNFKSSNEKMWTNRRVNVRQNYGTDSGIIQTLAVGTEVARTGISDGKKDGYSWSRISYNGITGYVITGALTYDEPEKNEEDVTDEVIEENPEQEPEKVEENKEVVEENVENKEALIASISQELGAIPEVGINIMPFMFFGSCITCIILMIEIKRKIKS